MSNPGEEGKGVPGEPQLPDVPVPATPDVPVVPAPGVEELTPVDKGVNVEGVEEVRDAVVPEIPEQPRTEKDELVALMMEMGLPRNMAVVLAYLHRMGDSISLDMETTTRLRQPEVSVAVHSLMRRGWVKKDVIKKKTKGRPLHSYSLVLSFEGIIDQIEEDEKRRMERRREIIERLRELSRQPAGK